MPYVAIFLGAIYRFQLQTGCSGDLGLRQNHRISGAYGPIHGVSSLPERHMRHAKDLGGNFEVGNFALGAYSDLVAGAST